MENSGDVWRLEIAVEQSTKEEEMILRDLELRKMEVDKLQIELLGFEEELKRNEQEESELEQKVIRKMQEEMNMIKIQVENWQRTYERISMVCRKELEKTGGNGGLELELEARRKDLAILNEEIESLQGIIKGTNLTSEKQKEYRLIWQMQITKSQIEEEERNEEIEGMLFQDLLSTRQII